MPDLEAGKITVCHVADGEGRVLGGRPVPSAAQRQRMMEVWTTVMRVGCC